MAADLRWSPGLGLIVYQVVVGDSEDIPQPFLTEEFYFLYNNFNGAR
jgi:hypothetical protein